MSMLTCVPGFDANSSAIKFGKNAAIYELGVRQGHFNIEMEESAMTRHILHKMAAFLSPAKSSEAQRVSKELHDVGYAVLHGVLSDSECDAICRSFDDYVASNKDEANQFVLSTTRHSRLGNLHLVSDAACAAITKPRVMDALDTFFGSRAYVATSLFFEQSSEQAVHRDTPFFNTRPNNLFAGTWFALEDVHEDAGPLQYYPGGHKMVIDPGTAADHSDIPRTFSAYTDRISAEIDRLKIPKHTALIRKGDAFIWHPELPHGGTKIASPGRTRKSMVFHCSPESETMYGCNEFFGVDPYQPKAIQLVDICCGRKMMPHARPMFAENN